MSQGNSVHPRPAVARGTSTPLTLGSALGTGLRGREDPARVEPVTGEAEGVTLRLGLALRLVPPVPVLGRLRYRGPTHPHLQQHELTEHELVLLLLLGDVSLPPSTDPLPGSRDDPVLPRLRVLV